MNKPQAAGVICLLALAPIGLAVMAVGGALNNDAVVHFGLVLVVVAAVATGVFVVAMISRDIWEDAS